MTHAYRSRSAPVVSAALASLALAPFVSANGVRIVDAVGDRNYSTIGAAITDAQPGEILLIGDGIYPGFTIDKPLTLVATPRTASVTVNQGVTINGVTGGPVTLIGLNIELAPVADGRPLLILNSEEIRLRDCRFAKALDTAYGGFEGIGIISTASVVIDSCSVEGSEPEDNDDAYGDGFSGGDGIFAHNSRLAIYSSTLIGGRGGFGYEDGGYGGSGLSLSGSLALVSGSSSTGGVGGAPLFGSAGMGGSGISASSSAAATVLDSTIQGAPFGPSGALPGDDYSGFGSFTNLPGPSRTYSSPTFFAAGGPLVGSVDGEPRDRIQVLLSPVSEFQFAPGLSGVWHIAPLQFLPVRIQVPRIPATGQLDFELSLPPFLSSQVARQLHGQGLTYGATSGASLGNTLDIIELDRASTPDCNQNGILDYVEIIEGTVLDADQDLIPDSCQAFGPVWH